MLELILLAFALAMDCFAVSVVSGVIVRKNDARLIVRLAFLFGFFQALMPLIGWFLTNRFAAALEAWDHWIAFAMLAFIGGKMILDSFKEEEEAGLNPRDFRTQVALAVATSIDALACGVSFALIGCDIWLCILVIGLTTAAFSIAGLHLGHKVGTRFRRNSTLVGGAILILIGLKILVEHLFF